MRIRGRYIPPDFVSGSSHQHLQLIAGTDWIWGLVATAFVVLAAMQVCVRSCGSDCVVGLALGVAGVWIFFAVVSVFSPNGDRQQARTPLTPLLQPHEFSEPGVVLENDEVKVTAAVVNHPPVVPAFAYRFDTADRSIVISGDTNENAPGLVRLAQGADVLVHEFLSLRLYNANPNPNTELAAHVRRAHTPATEVGRIATAAKVKTLVLSHFVPSAQSQYLSTKCDSPTTGLLWPART